MILSISVDKNKVTRKKPGFFYIVINLVGRDDNEVEVINRDFTFTYDSRLPMAQCLMDVIPAMQKEIDDYNQSIEVLDSINVEDIPNLVLSKLTI